MHQSEGPLQMHIYIIMTQFPRPFLTPLMYLNPMVKWCSPETRGPENMANSNYHLQTTPTPLECSCVQLYQLDLTPNNVEITELISSQFNNRVSDVHTLWSTQTWEHILKWPKDLFAYDL